MRKSGGEFDLSMEFIFIIARFVGQLFGLSEFSQYLIYRIAMAKKMCKRVNEMLKCWEQNRLNQVRRVLLDRSLSPIRNRRVNAFLDAESALVNYLMFTICK